LTLISNLEEKRGKKKRRDRDADQKGPKERRGPCRLKKGRKKIQRSCTRKPRLDSILRLVEEEKEKESAAKGRSGAGTAIRRERKEDVCRITGGRIRGIRLCSEEKNAFLHRPDGKGGGGG